MNNLEYTEKRNTGRTQRMLSDAALSTLISSYPVYVVLPKHKYYECVRDQKLEDKYKNIGFLHTGDLYNLGFDWATLSFQGMHPEAQIFIDHYIIESTLNKALLMMKRYDL